MFKPNERQKIHIDATLAAEQARKPGIGVPQVGDFIYHVYVSKSNPEGISLNAYEILEVVTREGFEPLYRIDRHLYDIPSRMSSRSEISLSWFHQHPQMVFDDGATQDFFFDYETAKKFYRKAIFDRIAKIEQNIGEELRAIEDLCVKQGASEAMEFYVDDYYDGRE